MKSEGHAFCFGEKGPTNPSNCNDEYKDFVNPAMPTGCLLALPVTPKTLM
jgi:hypothetical protein